MNFFKHLADKLRWLLYCGLLWLAACTSTPPQPTANLISNEQIHHWRLSGKMGLRNNGEAHSAYLNWQQCGDEYDIRLSGPLGQGSIKLLGNRIGVALHTGDGQVYYATSPEELMEQHLGWSLPLSQLPFWLRGLPAPHFDYQQIDNSPAFNQQQWQLLFPKLTSIEGYQLPAKIIAEHPPYKATIVIKDWQLHPNCPPAPRVW